MQPISHAFNTAERPYTVPSYLSLTNFCGSPVTDELVYLNPSIFAHPIRRDILHACVTWYRDSIRTGTAHTKTRSEVHYSGKKIRPQKGTGKARLGDRGSPMLRGGGVAFGPRPRDFRTLLPRKVKDMGLRVALSARLKERMLFVCPSVDWPNHKTKNLDARLKGLGWDNVLLVTGKEHVSPYLAVASRNLKGVVCKSVGELEVWDVLKSQQVVLDLEAVQHFEERLGKGSVQGPGQDVPALEATPS